MGQMHVACLSFKIWQLLEIRAKMQVSLPNWIPVYFYILLELVKIIDH